MAFEKSLSLLRLAEMAAARHQGVSLLDVMEEFAVNQRTAQRMMRGLEAAFASVVHSIDDDRRKWWKLQDATVLRLQGIRDSELAALDMSIRRAQREGADLDAAALVCLRDRILATMPGPHARRAAGIEGKTAHGIRKHRAQVFRENGATPDQRMAILGHDTSDQEAHYSKAADLRRIISRTDLPNSPATFGKIGAKT